ncbi:cbb3-type cytochrome oxidase assembly protein CcoS [Deferribacter thermophilus]
MSSLFLLIPISLILGLLALFLFFWADRSDQFDDVEGPKYRILDDEDED